MVGFEHMYIVDNPNIPVVFLRIVQFCTLYIDYLIVYVVYVFHWIEKIPGLHMLYLLVLLFVYVSLLLFPLISDSVYQHNVICDFLL